MNPLQIIKEAIKAVPSVRYALGVAGIAAVVALVLGLKLNPQVAVFGTLIVLALMFILVLFSQYAGSKAQGDAAVVSTFGPITVLVWFYTIALVIVTSLFISSYFWHHPPYPFPPPPPPPPSVQRFRHDFSFEQQPFNIAASDTNTWWQHGVSPLVSTDKFAGKQLQIEHMTVWLDVDSKKDQVCCDVWVYVGPTRFGFPSEGGSLNKTVYPPYGEPPAASGASMSVKFVIGNDGAPFHTGHDTLWAKYDFTSGAFSGYPHVDRVKQPSVSQQFGVADAVYAQVLVWNGNPSSDLDVRITKVEISGTLH